MPARSSRNESTRRLRVAIRDARALGIDDQREQVLPQREPRAEAARRRSPTLDAVGRQRGSAVRPGADRARRAASRCRCSRLPPARTLRAPRTSRGSAPPSRAASARRSRGSPGTPRRRCRSRCSGPASVVIQRGSAPSNSRFACVGHTGTQAPQWMQVAAGPASFSARSTSSAPRPAARPGVRLR